MSTHSKSLHACKPRAKKPFLSEAEIRELEEKFTAAIERLYNLPAAPRKVRSPEVAEVRGLKGAGKNMIEVTMTIPEILYQILQAAARKEKMSLRRLMLRDLVIDADSYVAENHALRDRFGLEAVEGQYQIPIAKLAGIPGFQHCSDLAPEEEEEPQLQRAPGQECRIIAFPQRE